MIATIIIAGIIIGLVALVVYRKVRAYRNGESGCGCGCSGCSASKSCHLNKPKK